MFISICKIESHYRVRQSSRYWMHRTYESIFMSMNVSMVVIVLEENFCRTIKQIFEAQHRLKEKNWEYKLQV